MNEGAEAEETGKSGCGDGGEQTWGWEGEVGLVLNPKQFGDTRAEMVRKS